MVLSQILVSLAKSRPIFYSEADFQHAFAWMAKSLFMCEARLEVRMIHTSNRASLDLLLRTPDDAIGIEFKYVTKPINVQVAGELFQLRNQGALDILRYDCLKDISRLENAIGSGQINRGYFVILTNDPSLWSASSRTGTADEQFKIHQGQVISGIKDWGQTAGEGTRKGRESAISLSSDYVCNWNAYSVFPGERNGTFQSMVIPVTEASTNLHSTSEEKEVNLVSRKNNRKSGKYAALTAYLISLESTAVELTFNQVDEIVSGLPPTAFNHSAYWSNHPSHPPAVAWLAAGWEQERLDFTGGRIWLRRKV